MGRAMALEPRVSALLLTSPRQLWAFLLPLHLCSPVMSTTGVCIWQGFSGRLLTKSVGNHSGKCQIDKLGCVSKKFSVWRVHMKGTLGSVPDSQAFSVWVLGRERELWIKMERIILMKSFVRHWSCNVICPLYSFKRFI